jgi:CRP/FNR family cyclic AMP-dependent transcriptional regulator
MRPQDKYLEKIKTIQLFDSIKDDEEKLRQLLLICDSATFKKGEAIIKEGDNGSEMFILYSGAVDILKRTREGDNYTVVKLTADIPAGVVFGDLAMVDDDRRSATVLAAEDSEFLVIKKDAFLRLGDMDPALGLPITRAIAKRLAGQLRKTTSDMLTIFDALVNELKDG